MNLFHPLPVYISRSRSLTRGVDMLRPPPTPAARQKLMSSPNPYPQPESSYDELDRLVQSALKALNQQAPPERVWKRIRAELKAVPRPAPGAGGLRAMEPVRTSLPLPDAGPADQPPVVIPGIPLSIS